METCRRLQASVRNGYRTRKVNLMVVGLLLLLVLSACSRSEAPVVNTTDPESLAVQADRHLKYVIVDHAIKIYDMDNGHSLVRNINIPKKHNMFRIRGVAAHAATAKMYISYWGDLYKKGSGYLLSYDLKNNKVIWVKLYQPSIDSMAITPDGKTIYMPCGEERKDCNFWFVLNAATGKIKTKIPVYKNTHNTIVSLNGERVYMASLKYNYLSVADTKTNRVIQKIGPFGSSIRPFTINGAETLAFVNVDFLSGFEVGDITTGKKLYRVQVEGFPWEDPKLPLTQSHGVALTPDEKEVWVVDGHNHYLHVFDVTGLPNSAPKQVASIPLTDRPRWINVSRDGRFAHVSTGEIVSTKTRKTVAKVALSKHYLQIDFAGNVPVQAYSRYGVGYVTRSAP